MNVKQQHIEINLSAQKIASNVFRKFDPSELDWILNKMVDRFIKDRIKQDRDSLGFDATEIDLDALRTLVVLDRYIPTYKADTTLQEVYADLPGDYSFLIDDSSSTIDSCSIYYPSASKFVYRSKYIYTYQLKESDKDSGPFYQSAVFTLGGIDILTLSELPGLSNKSELFTFKDYVLSQLWNLEISGIEFYWERFGSTYSRNSIIVVCDAQKAGNTLTLDGSGAPIEATELILARLTAPLVTAGLRVRPNRLIRGQVRSNILDSAFARTKPTSPVSAITGGRLKAYYNEMFSISKFRISYIRKPQRISLSLNQDCDLAEEFHMQICDMAVLYIKELTGAPDWEIKLRDNMESKN